MELFIITNVDWLSIAIFIVVLTFIVAIILAVIYNDPVVVVTKPYDTSKINEGILFYYLPESLVRITATAKVAVVYNEETKAFHRLPYLIEQIFSCQTELVADTDNLLTLEYKSNGLMEDELKFEINSNGLLKTVNVTTADRTNSFIAKLTDTSEEIFTIKALINATPKISIKFKQVIEEFVVKATNIETEIPWDISVTNELKPEEDAVKLKGDFKISTSDLKANTLTDKVAQPKNGEPATKKNEISIPVTVNGILTKPIKLIQLKFQSIYFKNVSPLVLYLSIVDSSKIFNVPIKRDRFIKRINKVSIKDGLIISNEIHNPSAVEGFLSIPINIAKAIVSIPAQIISFRYDNTKKQNTHEIELLKQEIQKMKLEKEYMNTNMGTNG